MLTVSRGRPMSSFARTPLVAIIVVALSIVGTACAAAEDSAKNQPPIAESLLGEWWGEVTSPSYSWRVYLTLTAVQDVNRLRGVAYVVAPTTGSGTAYANRDHPIIAVLDGDHLSFTIPNGPEFSLT